MDDAAARSALLALLRERNARQVEPFREVFAAHASLLSLCRRLAASNEALSAELASLKAEAATLTSALRRSEAEAAKGAVALGVAERLEKAQEELRDAYKAAAAAGRDGLAQRDRADAATADAKSLGEQLAASRADASSLRDRLAAAASALDAEKAGSSVARAELAARGADRDEASARLARLQLDHMDLLRRFMEHKASESARVRLSRHLSSRLAFFVVSPYASHPTQLNEIQTLHEEVSAARATASSSSSAPASVIAAPGSPAAPAAAPSPPGSARGDGPALARAFPAPPSFAPSGPGSSPNGGGALLSPAPPLSPPPIRPALARHTLRCCAGAASAVAFSPGGGGGGGLSPRAPLSSSSSSSASSPPQSSPPQLLATCGDDRLVNVWDATSGALFAVLRGATAGLLDCCLSSDGRSALGCGADKALRLWDVHSSRLLHTLHGHADKVVSCAFGGAGDAGRALSGGTDRCVRMWDLTRGYALSSMLCHSNVNCVAPVPGGSLAASAHVDGGVRFWDARAGALAHEVAGLHPGSQATCVCFPAGGSARGMTAGGTSAGTPPSCDHLLAEPPATLFLTCGRDNSLRLLEVRTFTVLATLRSPGFRAASNTARCALSPDGRTAAAGSADGGVYLWDCGGAGRGGAAQQPHVLRGHAAPVAAVAWAPGGGGRLASADRNGVALIWEPA